MAVGGSLARLKGTVDCPPAAHGCPEPMAKESGKASRPGSAGPGAARVGRGREDRSASAGFGGRLGYVPPRAAVCVPAFPFDLCTAETGLPRSAPRSCNALPESSYPRGSGGHGCIQSSQGGLGSTVEEVHLDTWSPC